MSNNKEEYVPCCETTTGICKQETGQKMAETSAVAPDQNTMTRLADFIFEAGMLRHTPRSGYQFLGSGSESVAEHSYRTAIIGYILGNMAGCSPEHVAMLCLFHDFHEARVGDFNYVNSIYNTANGNLAMEHATCGTGLEEKILPLWDEQEKRQTKEALLAKDADQLDLIANLVEARGLGNPYATKWLEYAMLRLRTEEGQRLGQSIEKGDHTDWWFKGADPEWWVKKR